MGKASRWFRAVLGLKKSDYQPPPSATVAPPRPKDKRRWSFVKSSREKDHHQPPPAEVVLGPTDYVEVDPNKHAIAVAAATAAVAEAAVAAAHAAAEVVRLTSSGRCAKNPAACGGGWPEDLAAVKIQAAFRGYLARRALRALKALVRLQALVRGHIERKRTAEWLHRMQSLLRAQARARAGRINISDSSHSSSKSSHFHHPGPPTPEKFEHTIRAKSEKNEQASILKRTGSKSNGRTIREPDNAPVSFTWSERRRDELAWDRNDRPLTRNGIIDDEKSDKILEVDTGKHRYTPKRRNVFRSNHHNLASDQYSQSFTTSKDSGTHKTVPSPSSGEVQSLSPLKISHEVDQEAFCTAENSPQFYSASSRGGSGKRSPFTPTPSDGSRSFLSGYSDHPNYMSYTESSKAKLRSLSAPKQRPQYERSSSTKRYSINGLGEAGSSCAQRASAMRTNFTSKAYPGSGRLDRLGMPIYQRY